MENSNDVNAVVVDGQMTSVSLDDDNNTDLYSQEDDPQSLQKKRSWKRGWLNGKKNKTDGDSVEKDTESKADTVAAKSTSEESETFAGAIGSFGSSLLNICTLGLFSSAFNSSDHNNVISAETIVADLTASEAQLTMIDEETADFNTPNRSLISNGSVGSDGSTAESMISRLTKKRKNNSLCYYSIGILFFLCMCGLFIAGGILFSRNGW